MKQNNIVPLDFEKPLFALSKQIIELESKTIHNGNKKTVENLKIQYENVKSEIYKNLSPIDKVKIARHPQRPYPLDYINLISPTWYELHGDRTGKDDYAIVGGLIEIDGQTIMAIGTQKGRNIKENQKRNFGMPSPEGYRKALRLFYHAEKFNFPVITFIDTPGAYPGLEAEAHNQSQAIAMNLRELAGLTVPVISVIIGEGGSGGALAVGVANRILMLENSVYSVISPEGCSAILWRTKDKAADAANALKITAQDLFELGIIDEIIPEVEGGAHYNPKETSQDLLISLKHHLQELSKLTPEEIKKDRQEKIRTIGKFLEV
ncbi:MAG: acetyl-CoA carboxylase carboxyltransferase subunit alpha [Candidatus Melainabacteria bacterium RIFCSPHIGHO2_02_FULL_34_12]|nr:MAG: acetyl-CoA carboxylase carboxyltransferase subunit alpha [Candidatus Melainabacteria bacterium RIFCSPHIGHO2_02_FULL_34_12]